MKKQYIFGITTVLIWASMATVVKTMLGAIPNLEALSVSSIFAFLFLVVINVLNGKMKTIRNYTGKQFATMAGLGFIGLFLYSALYYQGIKWLSSQEACILNYLWPIMLVVFSIIILKEKLTVPKVIAMLCSFIGIIILLSGGNASVGGNRIGGIVCCLLAAAAYGLFSVLNKKADLDQNITMMVIWLVVTICAGILGIATEKWVMIRGTQWLGILWLGIVIDAVAYLFWALALKGTDNTASIANLAYLTPFLSVIVSAVFLHEKIQVKAIVALIFIVGGILIQNVLGREKNGGETK